MRIMRFVERDSRAVMCNLPALGRVAENPVHLKSEKQSVNSSRGKNTLFAVYRQVAENFAFLRYPLVVRRNTHRVLLCGLSVYT